MSKRRPPRCLTGPWHETQRVVRDVGNGLPLANAAALQLRVKATMRLFTEKTCEGAGVVVAVIETDSSNCGNKWMFAAT